MDRIPVAGDDNIDEHADDTYIKGGDYVLLPIPQELEVTGGYVDELWTTNGVKIGDVTLYDDGGSSYIKIIFNGELDNPGLFRVSAYYEANMKYAPDQFLLPSSGSNSTSHILEGSISISHCSCSANFAIVSPYRREDAPKILLFLKQYSSGVVSNLPFPFIPIDPDVASNEMILAMKKSAEKAVPMPNIPEMSVMWGPAESLLAAVNKSGEDVDTAAEKYQKEALTAIQDMK